MDSALGAKMEWCTVAGKPFYRFPSIDGYRSGSGGEVPLGSLKNQIPTPELHRGSGWMVPFCSV
jgi:hypothetical protein